MIASAALMIALSQHVAITPPRRSAPQSASRRLGVVTRPRLISLPGIARFYPPSSLARREQGTTRLRCTLSVAGTLDDCVVDSSSGFPALDAATFSLAAHARYEPMLVDGKAVAETVILPVRWKLDDTDPG